MTTPSPLAIDLSELTAGDRARAGGKATALGRLARAGVRIPPGICVTTAAYHDYLDATGIRQRLPLLLGRKAFADMRWEELWDLGLRIRNLFLNTPLPAPLAERLTQHIVPHFASIPVTVRSSAPSEDSAGASFAGLHDSFVNIRGLPAILDHLRLVWASLWSDRALLYRRELGLDTASSAMAVIIQELILGDCSGVAFSQCPGRPQVAAIEAVWGLNQGLVDGDVEADRYLLDSAGNIVERHAPGREHSCQPVAEGVALRPLPKAMQTTTPLSDAEVRRVFALLRKAEKHFGAPQDLEWTLCNADLYALQSRPITAAGSAREHPDRAWHLSLHKSLGALRDLRRSIEDSLLPAMARNARRLEATDLTALSDEALAAAIRERQQAQATWQDRYRQMCIPMAHGIRLFGQLYNDRLRPAEPFAFLELLAGDQGLLAVQRNRSLQQLAALLRDDARLAAQLRQGKPPVPGSPFADLLARFREAFGDPAEVMGAPEVGLQGCIDLLVELAAKTPAASPDRGKPDESAYLAAFAPQEQSFAREVLDIGRAAYRLRDNDNLFVGRFDTLLREACSEARRRLVGCTAPALQAASETDCPPPASALQQGPKENRASLFGTRRQARQIVGQPAGPGLARGRARVIRKPSELHAFRAGEVLICDAVDPTMTFVVPLAAGIVERRGGMLIHGAIIAREYGIPCVTGVPRATERIRTGDGITVDGYLGLVTIATEEREKAPSG